MNRMKLMMITLTAFLTLGIVGIQTAQAASYFSIVDGYLRSGWTCFNANADPLTGSCPITGGVDGPTDPRYPGGRAIKNKGTSWIDLGRIVTLTPYPTAQWMRCTAQFVGRNWNNQLGPTLAYPITGRLEVLDMATSPSWKVVASQSFNLLADNQWHTIRTPEWYAPRKDLYVRIGVTSYTPAALYLDDFYLRCAYEK